MPSTLDAAASKARLPSERSLQGVRVPSLIYGTAWKEDETARLTTLALRAGFRGIDTANQRKHYFEAAVGEAVQDALRTGVVSREQLFLQSKFTFLEGQDHRLPYDPKAPTERQVPQSMASSLEHFGVDELDAYLLHGPSRREGLGAADWDAWHAMEELHREGRARLLGVSNVSAHQLEELHTQASVKPALVQNRCFTRPQADRAVRSFCDAHGILYEGFSLLTAIRPLLRDGTVLEIAMRTGLTPEQAIFRFVLERGVLALTGTTSPVHMALDLQSLERPLEAADASMIARLLGW